MKALIEALELSGSEIDYLFHLAGHLGSYGYGKISEYEFGAELENIRTNERKEDWDNHGVTYRNQESILTQYKICLDLQQQGKTMDEYAQEHKLSLSDFRQSIKEERANWESLSK